MNKIEELLEAVDSLPDAYLVTRSILTNLIRYGELATARAYAGGLWDAARQLTEDESLLTPLKTIRSILQ